MGPIYDCGNPLCDPCNFAFPNRTAAIAEYERRCEAYAEIERAQAAQEQDRRAA